MSDIISVTGSIATEPRHIVTAEGLPITTFRLASAQRRYDRAQSKWVDSETNWYTIASFRGLAVNAAAALHKGERVLVRGRIRVRDWTSDARSGTTVEIEAESIGHDLLWGTTTYSRSVGARDAGAGAAPAPGAASGAQADGTSGTDAAAGVGWATLAAELDDDEAAAAAVGAEPPF